MASRPFDSQLAIHPLNGQLAIRGQHLFKIRARRPKSGLALHERFAVQRPTAQSMAHRMKWPRSTRPCRGLPILRSALSESATRWSTPPSQIPLNGQFAAAAPTQWPTRRDSSTRWSTFETTVQWPTAVSQPSTDRPTAKCPLNGRPLALIIGRRSSELPAKRPTRDKSAARSRVRNQSATQQSLHDEPAAPWRAHDESPTRRRVHDESATRRPAHDESPTRRRVHDDSAA